MPIFRGSWYDYSAALRRTAVCGAGDRLDLAGLWRRPAPGVFHSIVEHSQTPGALPLTFIARERTACGHRGALALRSDHPTGSLLAALYVDDAARGKGLAGLLQKHVIHYAAQAGYDTLHLWSACRDFYERYGWQYIGDALEYPDKTVHLYRYSSGASAGDPTE